MANGASPPRVLSREWWTTAMPTVWMVAQVALITVGTAAIVAAVMWGGIAVRRNSCEQSWKEANPPIGALPNWAKRQPDPKDTTGSALTDEERLALESRIYPKEKEALLTACDNESWNTGFRILIIVLGTLAVYLSATATSQDKADEHRGWTKWATVVSSLSAALATFAFTQVDFGSRHNLWQVKADGYAALRRDLLFKQPKRDEFLQQLAKVESWSETNRPGGVALSQNSNGKASTTPDKTAAGRAAADKALAKKAAAAKATSKKAKDQNNPGLKPGQNGSTAPGNGPK